MIDDQEFNTEEDVRNLLSKITNMKSVLVDHVMRQHEKFEDLEFEINEIASNFNIAHEASENIIGKSAKVSELLFLSTEDKEKYKKQVDSLKTMKQVVMDLIAINAHVSNLQSFLENVRLNEENLDKISDELQAVNERLKGPLPIRIQEIKVYNSLLKSLAHVKGQLKLKVDRLWENNIIINRDAVNPYFDFYKSAQYGELVPFCKSIDITIPSSILCSLIRLMYYLDVGYANIDLLLKFITTEIIYSSIEKFSSYVLIANTENNTFSLMVAASMNPEYAKIDNLELTFIENLCCTLNSLNEYLLSLTVPGHDLSLLKIFQKKYFDAVLTDRLTQYFLNEVVINQPLFEKLNYFIEFLKNSDYISSNNNVLYDYIQSRDNQVHGSDVTELLNNTRKLLSNSMLDCQLIKKDPIPSHMEERKEIKNSDNERESCLKKLLELEEIMFPECKVSVIVTESINAIIASIQLFQQLISKEYNEETILEIIDFLLMLPEMVMMYLYVVPITNKEVLDQLPLASVLHYNNCMYLAHYCLYWSTELKPLIEYVKSKYSVKLSQTQNAILNVSTFNMLPLVYQFRDAATECVTCEISKQKVILTEFFDRFSSFRGVGNENRESVHKAIKKCCYHLTSLTKVYSVFPDKIFNYVFGTLVDWAVDRILGNILNIPDIIQTDNDQLIVILKEFKSQLFETIKLRKESSTLHEFVDSYLLENCSKFGKLLEVLFILENGLQGIEERWVNNTNSMHEHISPVEVRNMIKALFKNSHMRSKVIEKIA